MTDFERPHCILKKFSNARALNLIGLSILQLFRILFNVAAYQESFTKAPAMQLVIVAHVNLKLIIKTEKILNFVFKVAKTLPTKY